MKSFFRADAPLWRGCAKIADFVLLSCCWTLCCLPVVTVVPSCVALYDATAHCVRGKDTDLLRRFFRTFKGELRRGILLTLLWAAAALVLHLGYRGVSALVPDGAVLQAACFVLLLLPLGMVCWAVAAESRFENTLPALHRSALGLTFGYLPSTAAIALLLALALNAVRWMPFLIMVVPGLAVYLQSFFIERILTRYMPDEDSSEDTPS